MRLRSERILVPGGLVAGEISIRDGRLAEVGAANGGGELIDLDLMASTNPARLLGLGHRNGAIAPGMNADLTVLNDDLSASTTLVGGRWAHPPQC